MAQSSGVAVRSLYQETQVKPKAEGGASEEDLSGLSKATFECHKFQNGVNYIKSKGLSSEESVREILLEGAQSFGMWRISETALQSLVNQVLERGSDEISVGLNGWVRQSKDAEPGPRATRKTTDLKPARNLTLCGEAIDEALSEAEEDPRFRGKSDANKGNGKGAASSGDNFDDIFGIVDVLTLRRFKWCLAVLMTAVSFGYAKWVVFDKYEGILEYFAWPIIFARAGGMGTAIITGLMYLSMAKTFMKQFYKCLSTNSKILMILDGHKDVHIFLARCLMYTAGVHVLAHLLSTVPAVHYSTPGELNTILACANRDVKLRDWPSFKALQWPECPLTMEYGKMGWSVLILSTPGVSGLVLVALLLLVGWTGRRSARAAKFDRFWYAHNVVLVAWPVTMFIHGSNQWIGVGFPLVAFTASLPICLYLVDRMNRLLKFYLFGGKAVKIAEAVIRPGKAGGPDGALTNLAIAKPPGLWTYEPGMYAFVCMPEYAPLQWHPFTICSGKDDEHVEFIIAGVGDWTQQLALRCLQAQSLQSPLPRVALDGPYAAPTISALSRPILVAVGAGVGITPFLSLMSSLISLIEDSSESRSLPLKEAHFFWMTRSVDEFLFGRKHFTRIASSDRLRQKVHLHLHTTAKEPENNGAAFLFRKAVKLQSKVDRAAFQREFDERRVLTAPQLPWCWVNKSQLDVMWLSDLTSANRVPDNADAPGNEATSPRPPSVRAMQPTASHPSPTSLRSPARQGVASGILAERQPSERSPARHGARAEPGLDPQPAPALPPLGSWPATARAPGREASHRSGRSAPGIAAAGVAQASWATGSITSWADDLLRGSSRRSGLQRGPTASLRAADDFCGSPLADNRGAPASREPDPTDEPLVPVAFGRPDFEAELRAIGQHWGCAEKVHVYACGNDAIVKGLKSTADALNAEARANAKSPRSSAQKYVVTYERFG